MRKMIIVNGLSTNNGILVNMVAKRQQDLVLLLSGIPVKVRVTRCSVEHLPRAQLKISAYAIQRAKKLRLVLNGTWHGECI